MTGERKGRRTSGDIWQNNGEKKHPHKRGGGGEWVEETQTLYFRKGRKTTGGVEKGKESQGGTKVVQEI